MIKEQLSTCIIERETIVRSPHVSYRANIHGTQRRDAHPYGKPNPGSFLIIMPLIA